MSKCQQQAGHNFQNSFFSAVYSWAQVIQAVKEKHSLVHVVEVYRGSNSSNLRRHNHINLSVHGMGKDYRCVTIGSQIYAQAMQLVHETHFSVG